MFPVQVADRYRDIGIALAQLGENFVLQGMMEAVRVILCVVQNAGDQVVIRQVACFEDADLAGDDIHQAGKIAMIGA